jgi:Holliday junction DNA helicase RuvA
MIAYIKGILADVKEDGIVVEAGSIGYNIQVAGNVLGNLPGIGSEVKIHTYTHVREDAFLLYGFLTKDDLEIFKKCITVSGIGPKGALAILSVMDADSLRFAIISGDAKAIAKAPGVAARTAERLILELKDKVKIEDTLVGSEIAMGSVAGATGESGANGSINAMKKDAVEALVALGYSSTEALKAVNRIEDLSDMDSEAILKAALKYIF